MSYTPLSIQTIEIGGLLPSMEAMKLPKKKESDSYCDMYTYLPKLGESDEKLAGSLIRAGNDHAKAMRGIIVWVRMQFGISWLVELETYRIGIDTLSTSSTMHCELKDLTGVELAEEKQRMLPEVYYTRISKMSYQLLRSIYKARRRHRHPDWRLFCTWIENLPYFKELIFPEFDGSKKTKVL